MKRRTMARLASDQTCFCSLLLSHPKISTYPVVAFLVRFFLFHHDFIHASHLRKTHMNVFGGGSRDLFADEIRFDRQFTVATINEDGKLNAARAAKVVEGI